MDKRSVASHPAIQNHSSEPPYLFRQNWNALASNRREKAGHRYLVLDWFARGIQRVGQETQAAAPSRFHVEHLAPESMVHADVPGSSLLPFPWTMPEPLSQSEKQRQLFPLSAGRGTE